MYIKIVIVGLNIVINFTCLGNSETGKSCLLSRYSRNEFNKDSLPTIGIEFAPKTIIKNNTVMKLNIMDTCG